MRAPWLVLVDLQRVFADPASPWCAAGVDAAMARVARLCPAYEGRVVATRFVAPDRPTGAWVDYYRAWPFALQRPDAPLYELLDPVAAVGAPVVTRTTFGKWDDAPDGLRAVTGGAALVLAGVSTDCCVLSTALAAADAGVRVQVVADACAGATPADHERALAVLRLYAPLVEVVEAAALLG